MKQSNLKVAITGLTISACLLTGSALAIAKAGNWHADSTQNQQTELLAMDTRFHVDLPSNLLLSTTPAKIAMMPLQISPPIEKVIVKETKANARIAKKKAEEPAAQVKPKNIVQVKPVVQAKKAVPSKSLKQAVTVTSKRLEPAKMVATVRKAAATAQTHTLEISSGNTIEYSRLIPVKATVYTAAAEENGSWGPYDYFGNPLKLGTIAVDPDVIPMGSTVYITGYSFDGLPAKGMLAKANDQGGSVQGKRVDIFIPSSQADATKFGMQDVKIYIVE